MSISRRDALLGATAAAAVTGLTVAPLAMKAADVKAALAGADPQIEALLVQLRAADARYDDLNARRHVALRLIPRAVEEARDAYWCPAAAPQDVRDAYQRHYEASGLAALDDQSGPLLGKISDIEAQIMQTPATTLHGALSKARVAWHVTAAMEGLDETGPDLDGQEGRLDDPAFIWSILQDLERLAGEA